jgi:hypothetical protein
MYVARLLLHISRVCAGRLGEARVAVERAVLLRVLAFIETGPAGCLAKPGEEVDVLAPDELAPHGDGAVCEVEDEEKPDEHWCVRAGEEAQRGRRGEKRTKNKQQPGKGFLDPLNVTVAFRENWMMLRIGQDVTSLHLLEPFVVGSAWPWREKHVVEPSVSLKFGDET